jgi:surfeit locus 1 family protein
MPEPSTWTSASDDPGQRRFYSLDPAAIGASLGHPSVAPFALIVIGPAGSIPEPVQTLPRPPNDHLSYALTWFSLSVALVIVFFVYVRQSLHGESAK